MADVNPPASTGTPESTASLLDRAKEGDRAALDELFARCLPPLLRWARGRLPRSSRGGADTVDLVQDVVLQTLKRIREFKPEREGALQAYLRSAVLNKVRDEARRGARRSPAEELPSDIAAADPSPLEAAIGQQAIERYEQALTRLHPLEREAIIARVELGYSYDQVAAATGRPSSEAARLAVRRALVRLAAEMGHAA